MSTPRPDRPAETHPAFALNAPHTAPDTGTLAAVEALMMRTAWAFDERDVEMLADCFASDAVMTFGVDGERIFRREGREAIIELQRDAIGDTSVRRRHQISNVMVERTGEKSAVAWSYLCLFRIEDGVLSTESTGWYRDEVTREDDAWRITRRHLLLDRAPRLG